MVGTEILSRKISGAAPCAAAATIQDDVIHPHLQRGINILLNMLRGQFVADRNTAGPLTHLTGEIADLLQSGPVRKPRWRDRGGAFGQITHLGNFAFHLGPRQVPAGAGFGPLPAFEMERLHLGQFVPGKPETP